MSKKKHFFMFFHLFVYVWTELWLAGFVGERVWVDHPECKLFVDNILTGNLVLVFPSWYQCVKGFQWRFENLLAPYLYSNVLSDNKIKIK